MSNTELRFDRDLKVRDIQDLSSADAIAGLFAQLGYRTDIRTEQTAGNLGLTAKEAVRSIKRIELIADQENLLQIYLFELSSVTVSNTRALARAFRNRAGNYLLVLTSDYERIDFVLLEKYVPISGDASKTIGQRQVAVRPRALTVQRRDPSVVHLRVLRRFTYTESDPIAQYDKLLSAYAIADWSEEFFNNRALFSDYFLLQRLPAFSDWQDDPKPTYVALHNLYMRASSRLANQPEKQLREGLLEPALDTLGFTTKRGKKAGSAAEEPDYYLFDGQTKGKPLAVCLCYPWSRSLDGKDDQRDSESPEENPGSLVVSLLKSGEAPWAIVTNGKVWRLYSQRAHSRATNYYEIDLDEVLAQFGPHAASPAEAFRYFWLLFRRQAFEPVPIQREGKEQERSFLDVLLADSEAYAKELGERLKERVFGQVFPHLAEGFITFLGKEKRQGELSEDDLATVFQGTLTLLYRLLFLLYAEARDLLPAKEARGYFEVSLRKLKEEIAEVGGKIEDEVEKRLRRTHGDDSYGLYERLMRLFRIVDQGDASLNVPVYNGGLFLTEPDDGDLTPEASNARFLNATRIPDRHLARAIDLIARDLDDKRQDLVFLDYKSLGVRQLGSIYEGLLEFKLRIADRKLGVKKVKGREVYVPYKDLNERQKARSEREGKVVRRGHAYLENDKRERKATGSYYTPDYIVKYIVENTVGPVLTEKFEAVRADIRRAQQDRTAFFKRQEVFRKKRMKAQDDAKANLIGRDVVDKLFDIKILDPAMGSGHFLVEAVDYVTDRVLDFLNAFPWNPVMAYLEEMRQTILTQMEDQGIAIDPKRLTDVNLLKRHVLKRCIYGVDLNPMAVELAKVSLWLDCFTLGAPLSFLDHHLRCGNSLIGVTVQEVQEALDGKGQTMGLFTQARFAGILKATDLMRHVGKLWDVTPDQVHVSRIEYQKASEKLLPFKRTLDIYTSRWFGNTPTKQRVGRGRQRVTETRDITLELLSVEQIEALLRAKSLEVGAAIENLRPEDREIARTAMSAANTKRFFHWELEFPEVFYGPRPGTEAVVERIENGGFDAVVGNPPWGADIGRDSEYYLSTCELARGQYDSYELFIERGIHLLQHARRLGMIIPDSILKPEHQPLRNYVGKRKLLVAHRLGEGLFEDVFRAAMVVVLAAEGAKETDSYLTVTLAKEHRGLLYGGVHTLDDIAGQHGGHRPLSQCWEMEGFQLRVGAAGPDEAILKIMRENTVSWDDICVDYRGVEFSQTGLVVACRKCNTLSPPPRRRKGTYADKDCPNCGAHLVVAEDTMRQIVADCPKDFARPQRLLRGEDVNRYRATSELWVDAAAPGINFKDMTIYSPPKLLVRKTGLGIYAALDNTDAIVPQAIYIFRRKAEPSPYSLEFVLGIINSRLALYYYLKLTGESEWKSFPYITQKVLKQMPLPAVDWTSTRDVKLHSRLTEMVTRMQQQPSRELDMAIEMCVWNLFGVSFDSFFQAVSGYLTGKVQALRIIRELFPEVS
jgi:Eco57I restriction-modification methylase/TaqI-like C-terminal specificity domain